MDREGGIRTRVLIFLNINMRKSVLYQLFFYKIGAVRFERTTSCTPYKCASQLRYAPR